MVSALTAHDAFARTSEGGIDMIIVDAVDPRVSIELARYLEALPDTPPLVLVSSSPSAPEISARIGAAAFLPRPFELSELTSIIARHAALRPVRNFEDFVEDEPTDMNRVI